MARKSTLRGPAGGTRAIADSGRAADGNAVRAPSAVARTTRAEGRVSAMGASRPAPAAAAPGDMSGTPPVPSATPLLLGFGLFLAWSLCLPWVRGKLGATPAPASDIGAAVHGLALICLAFLCNRRRISLLCKPVVICAGALATMAPALTFAATSSDGTASCLFSGASSLCEGLSLALLYLLWNEQYVKYPARICWPAYAASFATAPLAYFVLTAIPLPVTAVAVIALPPLSCWMLARCNSTTGAGEPYGEQVSRSWRFPWRPALLMAVCSFAHYMLMHLYGGTASMGQLGTLACAGALLAACTLGFERFDPRMLYKLCPPLMVCALLAFSLDNPGLAEAGRMLAYAGFTGFSLFTAFILSSICFRYGIHAAWLFGIVEGCSVLAHALGSAAGKALPTWSNGMPGGLVLPLDITVVALVLLSMLLLSERDFATTWGIRPAEPAPAGRRGTPDTRGPEATGADRGAHVDETAQASAGHACDSPEATGAPTPLDDLETRCARIARRYGLTHREEDVLALLAQGRTAQDIEGTLFISHNTAKGHIRHVYAKLGVHSREEAAALVREVK